MTKTFQSEIQSNQSTMDIISNNNEFVHRTEGDEGNVGCLTKKEISPEDNNDDGIDRTNATLDSTELSTFEEMNVNLPELINKMKEMNQLLEKNGKIYETLKEQIKLQDKFSESMERPTNVSSMDIRSIECNIFMNSDRGSIWLNDSSRMTITDEWTSTSARTSIINRNSAPSMQQNGSLVDHSYRNTAPSVRMSLDQSQSSTSYSDPKPATSLSFRNKANSSKFKRKTHVRLGDPLGVNTSNYKKRVRTDYTVIWSKGDLGISLKTFAKNRIGTLISSLEYSHSGQAAGIGNARLGDLLVSINDTEVESMPFHDCISLLNETPRPIALGFRSNPSSVTSPTSASTYNQICTEFEEPALENSYADNVYRNNSSIIKDIFDANNPVKQSSIDGSFRSSNSSSNITSVSLSEDIEEWLTQQDEIHNDLVILLTETICRCESLQQENLDQLQVMMQKVLRRNSVAVPPPLDI